MTYATQAEMIDRFGEQELAQRTNREDGETIDTAVLDRHLADADAEINGYLAARYALPLPTVPPLLSRLAADVARYLMFGDGATEAVAQRYKDAVILLKRLSSGEVKLGEEGAEPAASADANAVMVRAPGRVFGPDQLAGY